MMAPPEGTAVTDPSASSTCRSRPSTLLLEGDLNLASRLAAIDLPHFFLT